MKQNLKPYKSGRLSSKHFSTNRISFQDLHLSEQRFLTKSYIKPKSKILDIGCASGNLGFIILSNIQESADYTGVDVDKYAIKDGEKRIVNEKIELINGEFPKDIAKKVFDYICVFNLFEQIEDWKGFLFQLKECSNKYINIGLSLRMYGNTVIDIDTSYGYYFDSGKRVHKVVHNIYELINFCSLNEMKVKKISFFGYNIDGSFNSSGDYRAISLKDEIRGNLLLELYPNNVELMRQGALLNKKNQKSKIISKTKPEVSIIINNKTVDL